ncbi:galactosylceramide sulfotransferase-like [Stegodyphus dumicola]|uniref:galactosylceramide sulfotransferase-like n=1 Tax=Stegodyphus dumicola TaxID=202533 RepID=UPI0015AA1614|nr:galactosylceramide sulfotransferase-like [Stegodyphus dumicola]
MLPNFLKTIGKRCPQTTRRIVLLPLAILGVFGFLINVHISFMSSDFGICYPKTNIVFLKTHKCAGSSIQNILMRYGDSHNLTFVLPRKGNYLGHPAPFSRVMVVPPRLPIYNILAHHTRLDYREIKSIMPHNTVFITIIRDPVQIFESSFAYYRLEKFYGSDLHKFIQLLPNATKDFVNKRYKGKFGANQMFFDLGGNPDVSSNQTMILPYLDQLESWFDLVLVADRMDESLILLRHLMCWDIDDVVTFKLNARSPKYKSALNDEEKSRLRKLNYADVLLYNRFLTKFEKQVEAFGLERMASETAELRDRTQKWYRFCVKGEQTLSTPRVKPKYYYNPRVMVFEPNNNVTNSTCNAMTSEELPFTDKLRKAQMARFSTLYQTFSRRNKTQSLKILSKYQKIPKT